MAQIQIVSGFIVLINLSSDVTPTSRIADKFKALICFVSKLIYKLMGDNGFGDNGCAHVMCITICMNSSYYSKVVLHITKFNGLFQLVPCIQYEHLAHYLFKRN